MEGFAHGAHTVNRYRRRKGLRRLLDFMNEHMRRLPGSDLERQDRSIILSDRLVIERFVRPIQLAHPAVFDHAANLDRMSLVVRYREEAAHKILSRANTF